MSSVSRSAILSSSGTSNIFLKIINKEENNPGIYIIYYAKFSVLLGKKIKSQEVGERRRRKLNKNGGKALKRHLFGSAAILYVGGGDYLNVQYIPL